MTERYLIIDLYNRKFHFVENEYKKKGVYLGYQLYEDICSQGDAVLVRGALSGLLPGINQSYIIYYNELISTLSYSIINGDMGACLYSLNCDAIVFKGSFESSNIFSIDISENNVNFYKVDELKSFDYVQMKSVVENIYTDNSKVILFTGDVFEKNLFSRIFSTGNEIFNGSGLGSLFNSKGIKKIELNRGNYKSNVSLTKEYFELLKLFNKKNDKGTTARSCFGCSQHCFSCVESGDSHNIKYIAYNHYFDVAREGFSEEFLEDAEKLFYLFDVFSMDFMGVFPIIRELFTKGELFNEMGLEGVEKVEFKDFVKVLKNIVFDNNTFYSLLKSDIRQFEIEYNIKFKKTGVLYIPVPLTKKEKELIKQDFYPSIIFDMKYNDVKEFLENKSLFEFFGICPNNSEVYDEYWLSRVGEKIDSKFSNINRMRQYAEILLKYKYDFEKKYTASDRYVNIIEK